MSKSFTIIAKMVDIDQESIYPVTLVVADGKIDSIEKIDDSTSKTPPSATQASVPSAKAQLYLLPGFIDSHVHIESSMLVPSEFARLAVVHGTVATVSDPHEIANVCGMAGVEFMIENGKTAPFKFNFGAPSCVPATTFETAGASLNADQVEKLLERREIKYLSEMMNFPGVLNNDQEVMKKIRCARRMQKPVDGHAPGLRGELAKKYIQANTQSNGGGTDVVTISTDHECFTEAEALDKLKYGMKILIREGSAAKNFDALIPLLNDYPDKVMFCSDDKHPDSLVIGHINQLCARAVAKGINLYNVLKAACINPVLHYKLDLGLLRPGDPADFILVKDLENFEVFQTYINGKLVAENGKSKIKTGKSVLINNFSVGKKEVGDFEILTNDKDKQLSIPVIEALDGQLITNRLSLAPTIEDGHMISDAKRDILKIVVVNRYGNAPVAKAFIKNFGLKKGAIASSVAHDSHNIVAIGVDDESLCHAVNSLIEYRGGVCYSEGESTSIIPLPVGGLMSNEDGYVVARNYSALDAEVKKAGCTLAAPFMTLSFMALLVIPHLKLSDKGLFDGDSFQFV